jgi:hypothetical protein
MNTEGLTALKKVISTLETAGIHYMLGGSFASSFYGIPRATFDADLVVRIDPTAAAALYAALKDSFYADPEEIQQAAVTRHSFNLIHLETAFKVDIFPLKDDAYSKEAFSRRVKQPITDDGKTEIFIESPEDVVISKLLWHKLGGEISAKQPADIAGVLKTMAGKLDGAYIQRWASALDLQPLLSKIESSL